MAQQFAHVEMLLNNIPEALKFVPMDDRRNAVLLVEDSEEDVFFFKRALGKSGVPSELLLATEGKMAIGILSNSEARSRIGLVFLDLKLPFLSGFDVLRWIRSENFDPPIPVVVLSGSSYKPDKDLASELGAAHYLVKPITPKMIQERLSALGVCDFQQG